MSNLSKQPKNNSDLQPEITESINEPMIDQKVEKLSKELNLSFTIFEIQQIAESVKQNYEDRKSLNVKILQTIQRFISIQSVNEKQEIENLKNSILADISDVQKYANDSLLQVSRGLKNSNDEWEQIANQAIALFNS